MFYLRPIRRNESNDLPFDKLVLCLFVPPGPLVVSSAVEGRSVCPWQRSADSRRHAHQLECSSELSTGSHAHISEFKFTLKMSHRMRKRGLKFLNFKLQ